MGNLLFVFAVSVVLAYKSQYYDYNYELVAGEKKQMNFYIIGLIILMILFVGLRTGYNDTGIYITGFHNAEGVRLFLADSENLYPLHNPLFYFLQAVFRSFTDNSQLFLMFWAVIDIPLLVRYLLTYTDGEEFCLAIFIFFGLGTFVFGMAALKQISAMAILTLSIPFLMEKKYIRYILIVCIAAMIHTYAFIFLILPFFRSKPWGIRSLLLILITIGILVTFNDTITSLLEYADRIGKSISSQEIFDGNHMNVYRVSIFAIAPCSILIFHDRLFYQMEEIQELFTNMTIISFMIMLIATQNGANMFGRIATYFELGNTFMIPWVLRNLFNERSYTVIVLIAMGCFVVFFLYDNNTFNYSYSTVSIWQFILNL